MNSAEYVDQLIVDLKNRGCVLSEVAWNAALACVGWPYVFGDRGQFCTPANRRAAYNRTAEGKDKDNIKSKCKNFDGSGSCSGCKWYPDGKRVREFDCRGFTYWVILQVYGWKLIGAGCTSQWDNAANWKAKGEIADGIPQNVLVCVFYYKKDKKSGKRTKTLEHTGLYYNGQTVECSNGVQHSTTLNKKWEVWGIPACVEGDVPPMPDKKPTLRKGDSGTYVTLLQTMLIQRGYSLPKYGADGKFGNETLSAVKEFQKNNGLTADGVVGEATWDALDGTEPTKHYTVTVPGLTTVQAEALCSQYAGATMTEERG